MCLVCLENSEETCWLKQKRRDMEDKSAGSTGHHKDVGVNSAVGCPCIGLGRKVTKPELHFKRIPPAALLDIGHDGTRIKSGTLARNDWAYSPHHRGPAKRRQMHQFPRDDIFIHLCLSLTTAAPVALCH